MPVQETTRLLDLQAAGTADRHGMSYWDAAVIESARFCGCDAVLSEDMSDGANYDGVRVENPFREI